MRQKKSHFCLILLGFHVGEEKNREKKSKEEEEKEEEGGGGGEDQGMFVLESWVLRCLRFLV